MKRKIVLIAIDERKRCMMKFSIYYYFRRIWCSIISLNIAFHNTVSVSPSYRRKVFEKCDKNRAVSRASKSKGTSNLGLLSRKAGFNGHKWLSIGTE